MAHNGPPRTRIQCFSSELDVFWWHFRQARNLLFGRLPALYYLVLLAVWYTFVSAFPPSSNKIIYTFSKISHRFVETYKRGANSVASMMFFTREIRMAMFLRYKFFAYPRIWLVYSTYGQVCRDGLVAPGLGRDQEICS